jgi:hypothetical protein
MRRSDNCRCRSRFCYWLKTPSPALAAAIKVASAAPTDVVCLDNDDIGSCSLSKGSHSSGRFRYLVYAGVGINAKELDIEGGAFGLMRN